MLFPHFTGLLQLISYLFSRQHLKRKRTPEEIEKEREEEEAARKKHQELAQKKANEAALAAAPTSPVSPVAPEIPNEGMGIFFPMRLVCKII